MSPSSMRDIQIHPLALCESRHIGAGTRIWAFAHILPQAKIGAECNICDGVFVENDVVVGDRVTVKSGVQLWDGVVLEDDVFVGPNATFTNDRYPRSKIRPAALDRTVVRRGASIGANATILSGIEIGSNSMVGAGAVVTRSVPPNSVVAGNPARITGYVDARAKASEISQSPTPPRSDGAASVTPTGVGASAVHRMRVVRDLRGELSIGDFESEVPFTPKRYFLAFDVPSHEVRNEYAQKTCHQFLICVRGTCNVLLDARGNGREYCLDRPDIGIYVPPMIWGSQFNYSRDAVLLVFASQAYDPTDQIRSYDDYLALFEAPPT